MYPNEKDPDTILEYFHDIGRIMWFKTNDKLSNIIFHRPEVLTELIELLYSHTQEENWTRRVQRFIPFKHNDHNIEKSQYEEMIDSYRATGMMESDLLHKLLENESQLLPEVALEVLKTFRLIYLCGPRDDANNQKYIVPFFAKNNIVAPAINTKLVPLKADIFLRGLPVPGYVYTLITAAFLDINADPLSLPEVGSNGATVELGDGKISFLIHSVQDMRITLILLTPPDKIRDAWKRQQTCLQKLIEELESVRKAARFEKVFYCSHCMLTSKPRPERVVNPPWQEVAGEKFICKRESKTNDKHHVPQPLMYPCEHPN